MSKESFPTSSSIENFAGDPNCKHCGGLGYVRSDYPVGHPDFGKLRVCPCRESEITRRTQNKLYSLSQLAELKDLTFENFMPRGHIGLGEIQANSLEQAFNQAQHFANQLQGWLLLQGNYGCGKTHLAAAIANQAVNHGNKTLFITVPDLLDSLRFSYNDPNATFEERFEEIRQTPLLIMDDFGTQNATSWAQEKLFQIINYRYINHLPLVVTTNLSLREIEGRIRSRLEDPELVTRVTITAPDYRRPMDYTGHHELSSSTLHGDRTFQTFDLRTGENLPTAEVKNLERVFKATQKFAKRPKGWLVLTGTYGSGKTHLAAAIANYQAGMGHPPLFVMVPDLLDHLRSTFNPNSPVSFDRLFDDIRTSPLLILDDFGSQSMTPWVKEKLYQIINHRYNAQLPTIITTAESIEEMDPRVRSRLLDTRQCEIYALTVPAFTGKAK
ncbi:MAG: ATP-binding protein [Anaerolineae bacterium]|nr:ATP-binding protein [Anaerolineae bacterium]